MTLNYFQKLLAVTFALILVAGSSVTVFAENDWTEEQLETGQYSIADPNGPGVGAHIDPDNRAQHHIDQVAAFASFEVAAAVTPLEGCSCVVFRMDDVQDFFVSAVQVAIMDEFTLRGESLSIGPIQNFFGADNTVLIPAQTGETSELFEVFNHGWNHTDFTLDNLANQTSDMGLAQAKAVTQFGEAPNVFIPPFNAWNADTISAMGSNGLTILSSQVSLDTPADIFQADGSVPHNVDGSGIYHLPVDAYYIDTNPEPDEQRNPTEILAAIDSSIAERGYAVLLFHPEEFAIGAALNATAFAELQAVIDGVNAKNYPIRTFNQVVSFSGTVSINNVTQVEGNAGTTNFVFDVTRSDTSGSMSVDYSVTDGTATIGDSDYNAIPDGTLNFTDGGLITQTITVPVVGDTDIELDETFNVNLTNCVDCTIVNGQGPVAVGVGVGTIDNDDFPTVVINNVTKTEGNTGTTDFVFNVTRSSTIGAASVDYQTADSTATSPSDYTSHPLTTLNFVNGGVATKMITVSVNGELVVETDETFNVNLSNCTDCTILENQGVGTIDNDDFPTITISDLTQVEGDSGTTNFVFDVTRSSNLNNPSVQFQTADNTATSPSDYTSLPLTTLNFTTLGPLTQTITVPVVGDVIIETNETFNVNLSTCSDCTIADSQGVGTIIDNDTVGPHTQSIGSLGSTNGNFNTPSDISVDSNDRILVVDTNNNRIQVFNSAGVYQSQFGSPGSTNGKFNTPSDIAVDSNDRILVADTNNHRIQVFNSAGVYQSQFGSNGPGNGEFANPSGIAVDSNDRIIIADTGNFRVQVFNSAGVYQSQFGSNGPGNGQFSLPSGIAVDSNDRILVADTNNHRIQVFNSAGVYQSQFGSPGPANGQFSGPSGIAIKSADRILVADTNNDRIQVFDSSGSHLQSFGSEGAGDGMFNNPAGLDADSTDRIIVADTSNHRIQVFQASSVSDDLDSDGIPDTIDTENVITSSTTISSSHIVGNVTIQNGAILTIPNGLSVTITAGNNITVELGGGILVQMGGTLQIQSVV